MKKQMLFLVVLVALAPIYGFSQKGVPTTKASYYHSKFNGRKTATGETYWDHMKTAASNVYKLGTTLLVTNKRNGKSVTVVVNDRMAPQVKGRVDLSQSAFKEIAGLGHGVVPVEVEVLDGKDPNNSVM